MIRLLFFILNIYDVVSKQELSDQKQKFPLRGIMEPTVQKRVDEEYRLIQKTGFQPNYTMHSQLNQKMDPNYQMAELEVQQLQDETKSFKLLMVWDKKNQNKDNMAAIVHNHGGGGVKSSAFDMPEHWFADIIKDDVVMFYCDYRLAPQNKVPAGASDLYQAIKYIYLYADTFGVDKTRIGVSGESGGAHIALGAQQMLIKDNKDYMVKMMFLIQPMINDFLWRPDPQPPLNKAEMARRDEIRFYYSCLADDLEKQKDDTFLYPGKIDQNMVRKMPKTVLMTSEFDMMRRDTHDYKKKLEKAHKLAGFLEYGGVDHGFMQYQELPQTQAWMRDIQDMFRKHLITKIQVDD